MNKTEGLSFNKILQSNLMPNCVLILFILFYFSGMKKSNFWRCNQASIGEFHFPYEYLYTGMRLGTYHVVQGGNIPGATLAIFALDMPKIIMKQNAINRRQMGFSSKV